MGRELLTGSVRCLAVGWSIGRLRSCGPLLIGGGLGLLSLGRLLSVRHLAIGGEALLIRCLAIGLFWI